MKTILKLLLAAFVLSLVPTTNVCAQKKIETPAERNARLEREAAAKRKRQHSPQKWTMIGDYRENLAWVVDAHWKYGFIDKTGKLVIPCKWRQAFPFREGLAVVSDENDKYGYIDKTVH